MNGVKLEASFGHPQMCHGADCDDAHIRIRFFGGGQQLGKQEFGQESVAHVIRAKLDLKTFFGGASWGHHDAGIVHQYVKAIDGRVDNFRGLDD